MIRATHALTMATMLSVSMARIWGQRQETFTVAIQPKLVLVLFIIYSGTSLSDQTQIPIGSSVSQIAISQFHSHAQ